MLIGIGASIVTFFLVALAGWHRAYRLGEQHGRMMQSLENRHEIEDAVIAVARAEQLAATWERRAKAVLFAHFGDRKP